MPFFSCSAMPRQASSKSSARWQSVSPAALAPNTGSNHAIGLSGRYCSGNILEQCVVEVVVERTGVTDFSSHQGGAITRAHGEHGRSNKKPFRYRSPAAIV
ncbi:hypothetical protein AOLI_G00254110 [Acnodon oligacanthus]